MVSLQETEVSVIFVCAASAFAGGSFCSFSFSVLGALTVRCTVRSLRLCLIAVFMLFVWPVAHRISLADAFLRFCKIAHCLLCASANSDVVSCLQRLVMYLSALPWQHTDATCGGITKPAAPVMMLFKV